MLLPSVTVEYRDVRVEADALVGAAGIPSLINVAMAFLKVGNLQQQRRPSVTVSLPCCSTTSEMSKRGSASPCLHLPLREALLMSNLRSEACCRELWAAAMPTRRR